MKKTIVTAILCLIALVAAIAFAEGTDVAEYTGKGFLLAAENETRALLVHPDTLEGIVIDKTNGNVFSTREMDGKKGNKTAKNTEKSDFRVYYVVNEEIGTTNYMDSYSMAVDIGVDKDGTSRVTLNMIENGFEVQYIIGDDAITVDDLPKMIPVEKYNALLLPNWTNKQDEAFREYYRVVRNTQWVRFGDDSMGKQKMKSLYENIYNVGKYTKEDLQEDNEAYGYEIQYVNPRIYMTIRWQLDGDDLLMSVPCDAIDFSEKNVVTSFDIAQYFMTASTEDEGYIFVPDGSGSLIMLNNGKNFALNYEDDVYGKDLLKNTDTYRFPSDNINLPVYGIKKNDTAVFAIIENGAEMATIKAAISGNDEFNRVYATFTIRDLEFVSAVGNATSSMPRYPDDVFEGDVVVRYKFLSGDDADAVGMAKTYRKYLLDRGMLTEREEAEKAPIFVEFVGAVRKTKFIMGVPINSTVSATTFAAANDIVKELVKLGVHEPIVTFSGAFAGGVDHESLRDAALDDSVGSVQDMEALKNTVESAGGKFFVKANMVKVFTGKNFKESKEAARRQDNYIASVTVYAEPILSKEQQDTDSFYVSPSHLESYVQSAAAAVKKFPMSGLMVDDLGGTLIADYTKNEHTSRVHATGTNVKALDILNQQFELILNDPNDYAMGCAEWITGLSSTDNGFKLEDYAIPFTQWVLEGCAEYTTSPWNERAYAGIRNEFLYAIETKAAPYFQLTSEDETVFLQTETFKSQSYFMTHYTTWLNVIPEVYEEYSAFREAVRGTQVKDYDVITDSLRKVIYDNGVVVYVNYGAKDASQDGYTIPAKDYLIVEGGAQ